MLWTWLSQWIMWIMILKILQTLRRGRQCVSSWSSLKFLLTGRILQFVEENLALDWCLRVCTVAKWLIHRHLVGDTVEEHNLNECGLKVESWNTSCNRIRSFIWVPFSLNGPIYMNPCEGLILCFWTVIMEKSDGY